MFSKTLRNISKIIYNCTQQSKDIWSDTELLYHPKNPLNFQNGRCSLYQSQIFNRFRNYYVLISALGGFLTYYSAKKLYNYQDRRFIGILFYLGLLGITIRSMRSVTSQYQRLLISIDLLPCGRKVLIQHPSIYGLCTSKEIDIATISRPKDAYQKSIQKMEHVFPVIMDTQLLYLHRDPDFIVNKEILPAVMNAKYIKVD
ncbi:unnamed protein product [Paramecium primaurelia]|uniref:Uncharacterized protein n=1 Tax=Paramecium primaurelia TaxID=5886 RepID=A0A8S1JQD0_PARPR|nr:unnamed protein product [Paramecium primaurelia]